MADVASTGQKWPGSIHFSFAQVGHLTIWRPATDGGIKSGRTGLVHIAQVLGEASGKAMRRHDLEALTVIGHQVAEGGSAQAHHLL